MRSEAYKAAEAQLRIIADKLGRAVFGEADADETIDLICDQRDKTWRVLIASQPVEDHLIDIIGEQRTQASSLNLGRLKFHELETRIIALENPKPPLTDERLREAVNAVGMTMSDIIGIHPVGWRTQADLDKAIQILRDLLKETAQ